ncbi:MAG: hypothetical protein ABIA75_05920 [Candidatus Neomarinimicrobiota bacterium]
MSNAQVSISPTSVFIDNKRRFETILILNSTADPQEVTINYEFGYPISDSYGNLSVEYNDPDKEAQYSIANWIKGFPKSFILPAGQRQVVRLTVKPPNNLPDGMYWSRLKTTSANVTPPVGEPAADNITAQINFQFEQVTSVFYKSGTLSTGLEIENIRYDVTDHKLIVYADLKHMGNSPYLGSMIMNITELTGAPIKDSRVFISVYFDGTRRVETEISNLVSGAYNAIVSFTTKRDDIPDENLVQANPTSQSFKFTK